MIKVVVDQPQGSRTVDNDGANFDAIYREYCPRIHRYLARLIGLDEAEDVAQEVLLKISRSLGEFRGESSLLTWVYRIATNAAMDRIRTPAFRARLSSAPLDESCETGIAPTGNRPYFAEVQAIRSEMNGCVKGLLAQLPDTYRTVLVLSEMEGMKDREIAEVLGVTLETVKIRLHRARAQLKKRFKANCDFYRDSTNTLLCDIKRQPN